MALTDSDYIPSSTDLVRDGDNEIIGVSVTHSSDTVCDTAADGSVIDYEFTMTVICDPSITAQGGGEIKNLDDSNPCNPVVTVNHADGCYQYTANSLIRYLSENPYVLGVFLLIVGPIIAMCGKRWFPYIAAAIGGMSLIGILMLVAAALGWFTTWGWVLLIFIICVTLGVLFGMLLRRFIWFAIGLIGIIGGFLLGAFVYTLILKSSGWESYWGFWGITLAMAILGGVLAYVFGQTIVLLATSFFGSYLFVSGLNDIFGGSPGLAEMGAKLSNGEPVVFT